MKNQQPTPNWLRNLPNFLTISRIAIIPIMLILFPIEIDFFKPLCGILILLAAITDIFDGMLARKLNATSKVGALLDPIADKMVDAAGLFLLVAAHQIGAWIAVTIVCRDIAVSGMRLIALESGFSVGVNIFGKAKSWFTVAALVGLMIGKNYFGVPFHSIGAFSIWAALLLTMVSFYLYWLDFWTQFKNIKTV